MATVVFSAAGSAIGNAIGGGIGSLASATIGRAAGAAVGRAIDQQLLGEGSEPVETGKVDTLRLTGASEGTPISQVYGRMRVGGHVIWASQFRETTSRSGGGGKGTSQPQRETISYSYTVSLAIALCEGTITGVGRMWAEGREIATNSINMRVYPGDQTQLPDPLIEAIEGAGEVPGFRGTAYVVIEDLDLSPYGNRVPQFSFEVLRPAEADPEKALSGVVKAVAMMPGTGEYALATAPVYLKRGFGQSTVVNVNNLSGDPDFVASVDQLGQELPGCGSTSLIVSWFGNDLRAGSCSIQPKVEQKAEDASNMPWRVAGLTRDTANQVITEDGRPLYGGTPSDQSVVQALQHLRAQGQDTMFYPFILMDQTAGNTLTDPYSGASGQPTLPWRGRITTSLAPNVAGTPDRTAAAEAEVAAFFGAAQPSDFSVAGQAVTYTGPAEFSYRRFILHYAYLCAAAGGVDAFCVGSEMRGLTQIRGAGDTFPAVEALRQLAQEVKAILPATKVSYAADWSEYFGYQPQDGSGDCYFHLDPLWSDPSVDFIGIDNYMPISDWRDGEDHADAEWGSIYNLDYLKANVAGGEGYDWFYTGIDARNAQRRDPITDGAEAEPWVFRYKDILNWWRNNHHPRIGGGVRQLTTTDWEPMMKPIWFTEMGCAAIDKGTNQPNKFLDPKSSESAIPRYSSGERDDLIQLQYVRAMHAYWEDPANNPISDVYGGPMIDMSRAHVWAWDARPFPFFPGNTELWSDGDNYTRGHWITGRTANLPLAAVVREICARSGVTDIDVSNLHGLVRGYHIDDLTTAREALQPLMLTYGFDAVERDGKLVFFNRTGLPTRTLTEEVLARPTDDPSIERTRSSEAAVMGRAGLTYIEAVGNFEARSTQSALPDETSFVVSTSSVPLSLLPSEAKATTERWLLEARIARDTATFVLPPSQSDLGVGDVVRIEGEAGTADYRLDRIEDVGARSVEAVRMDQAVFRFPETEADPVLTSPFQAPVPAEVTFLDLPLLDGDEVEHAPYRAVSAEPWPGSVALYRSTSEADFQLDEVLTDPSVVGTLETPLATAPHGLLDRGAPFRVRLLAGTLSSATQAALLAGANRAAIGDGQTDIWEVIQFESALLLQDGSFEISGRLRGLYGTDAFIPTEWPVGSLFVLLDGGVTQLDYPSSLRGINQTFRYGPAQRPIEDPAYQEVQRAFLGAGLRPYRPAHVSVENSGVAWDIAWIRRTRVDGDLWDVPDVALGEAMERYSIRVRGPAGVLREVTTTTPNWSYDLATQASDGAAQDLTIEVAQVSDRFGPGPYASVSLG